MQALSSPFNAMCLTTFYFDAPVSHKMYTKAGTDTHAHTHRFNYVCDNDNVWLISKPFCVAIMYKQSMENALISLALANQQSEIEYHRCQLQ